jgi:hypothetical protein
MSRPRLILRLALFLGVLMVAHHLVQASDLSGTWVGKTLVGNEQSEDYVTLVLAKTGDSYAGTLTDSLGLATNCELKDVKFSENKLTFNFIVNDGTEVTAELSITGEKLVGGWSSPDSSGNFEFELKK